MIICALTDAHLAAARRLAEEYLTDADGFDAGRAWRPDLVWIALLDDRVIGVCVPAPGAGTGIVVDGIAVEAPAAGQGIGSRLLAEWEDAASAAGFTEVTVGSAGGYVEHFYAKNGYRPIEYCVTAPRPAGTDRLAGLPVTRVRQHGDGVLINVGLPAGTDPRTRADVLAATAGSHLSVIFAKTLAPTPDECDSLIGAASRLSTAQSLSPGVTAGYAGAALLAADGQLYSGRSLTGPCGVAFCGEVGAVLAMLKTGVSQIVAVAAVSNDHRLMPPCGRCREMMFQINRRNLTAVILLDSDRRATLAELFPERWQELWGE